MHRYGWDHAINFLDRHPKAESLDHLIVLFSQKHLHCFSQRLNHYTFLPSLKRFTLLSFVYSFVIGGFAVTAVILTGMSRNLPGALLCAFFFSDEQDRASLTAVGGRSIQMLCSFFSLFIGSGSNRAIGFENESLRMICSSLRRKLAKPGLHSPCWLCSARLQGPASLLALCGWKEKENDFQRPSYTQQQRCRKALLQSEAE